MPASRHTRIVNFDHIGTSVRDLKAARAFYGAALGAIGMKINMDVGTAFGMGSRTQKIFWLGRDPKASGGGHYAFRVDHRRRGRRVPRRRRSRPAARTTASRDRARTTGRTTTRRS